MTPAAWFRCLTLGTLVVCATVFIEDRAHAADAAATTAREHYERGTKLYDIGKYEDAIKEFEAAYEAKSDPALLYNLAQSHRLAGHSSEALQLYRNYLRYVPKAPNRADIEERIRTLEKTVAERPSPSPATPAPTTTPAAGTTGATPPTPATTPTTTGTPPAPQDPASPTATGAWPPPSDPNYPYQQPGTYPQQNGTYPPPSGTGSPAPYPPPAAPAAAPAGHRTAAIALCAVGGGLIVTGAIFGLVAKNQAKKVEDAAAYGDPFDPSVESLGRTSVVLQWIGYGLGAAALVTGVVLFNSSPAEGGSGTRVAALPMAGPGFGGGLIRVGF